MWCKLWSFFMNLFTDLIDTVAYGVKTIGTVGAEVLSIVAGSVGSAIGDIFGGSNLLVWIVGGVFAYFLLTSDKNEGSMNGTPLQMRDVNT